jgi:23S rRNA (uracil1939-C5)-methyltransferase
LAKRQRVASPPEEGQVAALNHDGEGIIRGEKVAFVPGALPGERIRFERWRFHRQHDEARLLEIFEPSQDRTSAQCAHFGVCGGCALQHLTSDAQLTLKQQSLAETLQRIGRVTPERWLVPLAAESSWNYRRRARLGAKYVTKRGEVLVGFRERKAPYIAALTGCPILAEPLDKLIQPLASLIGSMESRSHIPQIEVAIGESVDGSPDTMLVFRHLQPLSIEDRERLAAFASTHSVEVLLQSAGPDSIQPLAGEARLLRYHLPQQGLQFEFEPTDFVQINAAVNRLLITQAVELLAPRPESRVLDLFCGLGNFTLALAQQAGEVKGLEGDAGLVARAAHNAKLNSIENAHFGVANLFEPDSLAGHLAGVTHVLLDPPRAGAEPILTALGASEVQRIVYVSCHPGTLARDVGILCHEQGFQLQAAGVIDMFAHTNHVESIALLERRP